MSGSSSSLILRTVLASMRRLYPENLADKSWDNTGLLLESPDSLLDSSPKVLLTIDLTTPVVDEAIKLGASVIVAYHPIIFRPLKALTLANTQQTSLLRLVQHGISVYSPHTAVDAVSGGVNDWLADGVSGGRTKELERRAIEPVPGIEGTEHAGAGYGRFIKLKEAADINSLIARVKTYMGMEHLQIALSQKHRQQPFAKIINTIGVCAGSGGSVFRGVQADALFTGEMSHHEALAAVESGTSIIACFHSNSERGYLQFMAESLRYSLQEDWDKIKQEDKETTAQLQVERFEVHVSTKDKDPYEIL